MIAYSAAFWKDFQGPKIFLEGLSGIGARGLRVANEVKNRKYVLINDLNPNCTKNLQNIHHRLNQS